MTGVLGRWKTHPLKIAIIENGIAEQLSRRIRNPLPRSQKFVGRRGKMSLCALIAEVEQPRDPNVDSNQDDGVRP